MQVNRQSYEEVFLLYADGELNEGEMKSVEEFVDQNPDLAGEFELIQDTVLQPDESLIFENKELLYRKEKERKVFYFNWTRMAAAAAILVAFTITGWIFLGDKGIINKPVAEVKQPVIKKTEVSEKVTDEKNITPIATVRPSAENIPTVKRTTLKKIKVTNHSGSQKENNINNNTNIEAPDEPEVAIAEPVNKIPEHVTLTHDVVKTDPAIEAISVPVEPRAMESDELQPAEAYYAQSFKQEPDNDQIYFANTSLSKKSKLRGVLRKATRYLDRVTSLQ